jgi:hypothetical protein
MAPPAADVDLVSDTANVNVSELKAKAHAQTSFREPLKYSGSLDNYKSFDVTKVIGREFPELQITDILHDDRKLRDLAITGLFHLLLKWKKIDMVLCSLSTWCGLFPQAEHRHRRPKGARDETGRTHREARDIQSKQFNEFECNH